MRTGVAVRLVAIVVLATGLRHAAPAAARAAQPGRADNVPAFRVDPSWPKGLPNRWILGDVSGIAVDARDHVWVLHNSGDSSIDRRSVLAPPVVEFDVEGNVVQAWGGPGDGYGWPAQPHGITVDHQDQVWISGDADYQDTHVLKFTRAGKFLLQIGDPGRHGGSADTTTMGNPTQMRVDPHSNEVFVADGELNHRVVVFDAGTGAYRRHWGAYGEKPDDRTIRYNPNTPPSRQFGHRSVHCIRLGSDGLVYVCDRANNRIQIFRKDGTFVKETFIARNTTTNDGSVWDLVFSPDQKLLYVGDGFNRKIWILLRDLLQVVGAFGEKGSSAGEVGELHAMDIDSKGNIYTGPRLQKFAKS